MEEESEKNEDKELMPERVLFCARLVVCLCTSFSQSITTDAGAVDVVLIWVDLGRDPEVVKCLQSQVMTKSGQALLRKRDVRRVKYVSARLQEV